MNSSEDKARLRSRLWARKHKDQVRALVKAWRKANPDKVHEQNARRWAKNKVKMKAWTEAWRKKHPEKVKAATRLWRRAHPNKVRASEQRHYPRHRRAMIVKVTDYQRRQCAELGDYYIRHKLSRSRREFPLSMWPDSLLQLKRAELKLKRHLRNHHG